MSTTDLTIAPSPVERPAAPERRDGLGPSWFRVALACAVLVAAGGLRWWQGRQVEQYKARGKVSPFPLKSLPTTLGDWRMPPDGEGALDPEVARAVGCVDSLRRHYVNEQTGVAVEALLLYGPSTIAHQPEICYPGAGYVMEGQPQIRTIALPGGRTASFYAMIFAKGEGATVDRQQVFYAVRYDGRWTTDLNFKRMTRLPGLYKIQLTRRVGDRERLDFSVSNPCEAFLEAMLPEMERQISRAPASTAALGRPPARGTLSR